MLCNNCGKEVYGSDKICRYCGHANHTIDSTPVGSKFGPIRSSSKSGSYGNITILSLLLLLAIFCLPMFNQGIIRAELLPNDRSVYFIRAIELLFEKSNPFSYYVVGFNVISFISVIILFIASLIKSKSFCLISSGGGIVGLIYYLIILVSEEGAGRILNFSNTYLGVGFWIVFILLIISFVITLHKD